MRRTFLALILVASPSFLAGQTDPVMSKVMDPFAGDFGFWYPPYADRTVYFLGNDPAHDYAADLNKAFAADPPIARLICGYSERFKPLAVRPGPRPKQMVAIFKETCQKYKPTADDVAEINSWFDRWKTTVREDAAQLFSEPLADSGRIDKDLGIYFPPAMTRTEWLTGSAAGQFRQEVDAAFRRAPLLAASVCQRRSRAELSRDPFLSRYQIDVKAVCESLDDPFYARAIAEEKTRFSSIWLSGVLNTHLDSAAAMSVDGRLAETRAIQETIKPMRASAERFDRGLRALAMSPGDITALALVFRVRHHAILGNTNSNSERVVTFLTEALPRLALGRADSLDWKRAWRNFLTLQGDLVRARAVAREILDQSGPEEKSRDQIHLAVLDRIAGDPAPYSKLMENCPEPDRAFSRARGAARTPTEFCESVAADVSGSMVDLLGTSVPGATQIFLETNRQQVAESYVSAFRVPGSKDDGTSEIRKFAGLVNPAIDRAEKLPPAQRDQEGWELRLKILQGSALDLTSALTLLAMRPYDDVAVNRILAFYPLPNPRRIDPKHTIGRNLLVDLLQQKSSNGPDRELWTRGLRNYYFLIGEYSKAAQLQKNLSAIRNPDAQFIDRVLGSMLDLIDGKPATWKSLLANCPTPPKDAEKMEGGIDYCRSRVWSFMYRAIGHLDEPVLPPAFRTVMVETLDHSDSTFQQLQSLTKLEDDPREAEARYQRFLARYGRDLDDEDKDKVYAGLVRTTRAQKNWKDSLGWLDMRLDLLGFQDPGFPEGAWASLTAVPWGPSYGPFQTSSLHLLEQKLAIALEAPDFPAAKEIMETALALSFTEGETWNVRYMLSNLAAAMLKRGRKDEAVRIIGYLIKQPQQDHFRETIDKLVTDVKSRWPTATFSAELAPWNSQTRKPVRRRPQPPLATGRT